MKGDLDMLTVTEAASAHLAQMLANHDVAEDVAVRFVCEEQGIGLQQDSERPGDTTFEHKGRTVLLLDAQVTELLADGTLDVEGTRLKLQHPKEAE
jgi:Fe-S cluster assembly iron-binding protein IscA